ncbi:cytochrome P450 [Irpex rosettiformis]|uniref:Cytochrome P450 n=1 Tax=Irpex rosettiformis TaxID=378272 RepID=A0ACB8UFB4_9APHY|nr:cytochrome P450 [Irpex rosettiformis]
MILKTTRNIRVTVLSGPKAASVFFNHKNLSLDRGYMMMIPENVDWRDVEGMPSTPNGIDLASFYSRFKLVLGPEKLEQRSFSVLRNIDKFYQKMGEHGTIDLFHAHHDLVLQLLMRNTFPDEIADDERIVGYVDGLYNAIDSPGMARLPIYNRLRKYFYGFKLYRALDEILKNWQEEKSGEETNSIKVLLDRGDGIEGIISFAIGATYAGLLNTSRLISWVVVHLTVYPEWRMKVLGEIRELLNKYNATPETLDRIPFRAWDTDLPLLDMTANEILRSHGHGVLLRQNIGEAFDIDGCMISKNACVVYPMHDVHHNPRLYGPTPQAFSPGRIESMGDEKQLNFVAWGSGRHPCTGRHMAQLIYRQVLTHLLTRFECEVIDKSQNPLQSLPVADHNSLHLSPPINTPIIMKYQVYDT